MIRHIELDHQNPTGRSYCGQPATDEGRDCKNCSRIIDSQLNRDFDSRRTQQRHSENGRSWREIKLVGEQVADGGWCYSDTWLTRAEAKTAEDRWWKRGRDEAPGDEQDWVEHQCGGCKFIAALNRDWGICWNRHSPMDGRIAFEHNGCDLHSLIKGEKQ